MAKGKGRDFGSMLHEDHSAPANLPQRVIHEEVGCSVYDKDWYLDDTMRGIDDNQRYNDRVVDRAPSKEMY